MKPSKIKKDGRKLYIYFKIPAGKEYLQMRKRIDKIGSD